MRKMLFPFLLVTVVLLAACSGKKLQQTAKEDATLEADSSQTEERQSAEYDPTDAIACGLKGKVQVATVEVLSTYDNNGQLEEGGRIRTYETSFDECGNLTLDEWGNNYGYDADGKFYRGNHVYTRLERDGSRRIVKYVDVDADNEMREDNDTYFFTYDKQGRLNRIKKNGSLSHFDLRRQYKGDVLYPFCEILEDDAEGGYSGKTTINYSYSHFDERGNWTERVAVRSAVSTDLADEHYADSLHYEPRQEVHEDIVIEKRTVIYYE